jgi:hypothetical protein
MAPHKKEETLCVQLGNRSSFNNRTLITLIKQVGYSRLPYRVQFQKTQLGFSKEINSLKSIPRTKQIGFTIRASNFRSG